MSIKKAAIFPSSGIGDGLIFLTAAYNLKQLGYKVSIFHNGLLEIKDFFPNYLFSPLISLDKTLLADYDKVICQYDNSEKTTFLIENRQDNLSIFYPIYKKHKHGKLFKQDFAFDPNIPMTQNIQIAFQTLFNIKSSSIKTGLNISLNTHRKHLKRVVIHPTSKDHKKNWPKDNFLKLAKLLIKEGFSPAIAVSPEERPDWEFVKDHPIDLPIFDTLNDTTKYLYESGYLIGNDSALGHLASLLQIPTLTIANNEKRIRLWRPGFLLGKVIAPSKIIPNMKWLRLREKKWAIFISPKKALKTFRKILT